MQSFVACKASYFILCLEGAYRTIWYDVMTKFTYVCCGYCSRFLNKPIPKPTFDAARFGAFHFTLFAIRKYVLTEYTAAIVDHYIIVNTLVAVVDQLRF